MERSVPRLIRVQRASRHSLNAPAGARSLSKSLAATYRIHNGIPNDGNAEGDDEGRTGSKRHREKMQGEQSQAKSGQSGNGVRQHGCRGGSANAAMQNEHNAGVDDREHSKHAAFAAQFNPDAVQAAVKAVQSKEIGYAEFLRRIMEAGCSSYQVFFGGRKAMYFGRDGAFYTEPFPAAAK